MISIIGLTATVTLIQAIELARRASTKLQDGQSINIVGMSLLNIPSVIELTLPISLIVGSMLCFEAWNRSNEFVVSRGFGRSIWAILSPASFVAGMIGSLFVVLINPIGSLTSREYEKQMGELFGSGQQKLSVSADGIWLRDNQPAGQFIINGDMLDVETAQIMNPMIYAFTENNELDLRVRATSMQLTDTGWIIEGATTWQNDGEQNERGTMMLPSGFAALDLGLSSEPPNTIPFVSLPAFIDLLESAGLPTIEHRLHFHKLMSLPFLMIGLAMLSARATLTNMNRGQTCQIVHPRHCYCRFHFPVLPFHADPWHLIASSRHRCGVGASRYCHHPWCHSAGAYGRSLKASNMPFPLKSTLTTLLVLFLVSITPAVAQISITATVNGKPITNYDIEQRALFLGYATNIEINAENRDRIFEDALQLIIDDELRLDAARSLINDVESSVLPQVRDFINQNFGTDSLSGNRALQQAGIDPMTVQLKYTSDLAWSNFISTRFADKFSNIESRIDDELERIKKNASKPQVKLAEIVLSPSPVRTLNKPGIWPARWLPPSARGQALPRSPANILLPEAPTAAEMSAGP